MGLDDVNTVLQMQEIYTNLSILAPNIKKCESLKSNSASTDVVRGKRSSHILHMPVWTFGLCVVFVCILLALFTFWLCTLGALAKQQPEDTLLKRVECCCSGIPDVVDVTPEFTYLDIITSLR